MLAQYAHYGCRACLVLRHKKTPATAGEPLSARFSAAKREASPRGRPKAPPHRRSPTPSRTPPSAARHLPHDATVPALSNFRRVAPHLTHNKHFKKAVSRPTTAPQAWRKPPRSARRCCTAPKTCVSCVPRLASSHSTSADTTRLRNRSHSRRPHRQSYRSRYGRRRSAVATCTTTRTTATATFSCKSHWHSDTSRAGLW